MLFTDRRTDGQTEIQTKGHWKKGQIGKQTKGKKEKRAEGDQNTRTKRHTDI